MLTSSGKRVLAAAAGLYLAAWGFGTGVMFPVAIGLALAPLLAYAWVRTLSRPMRLRRTLGTHELVEGSSIPIGLEVRADGPLPARATLVDYLEGAGAMEASLGRRGRVLRGRHVIESAPRGRYRLHRASVRIADPFGLAQAEIPVDRTDAVLVYPRVYELDGMFTDAGAAGGDAARTLLHRISGYDLHSIRDFQHGESLRRVHWRSTAKRRRLMVKEMQDTPRDEAAVLLDGDPAGDCGPLGESSFDAAVRAAASILNRLVEGGQRCSLIVHGASRTRVRIAGGGGEWPHALGELAIARADANRPLAAMLAESMSGGGVVDAARVYVISGALSPALAERLLQLRSGQRDIAVVSVESAGFAGNPATAAGQTAGLRLARAGVPVVVLRQGDDLRQVLSAAPARRVVNA
ncbi:MAG: DUF58 domain-containing protein [Gaiellales bacterium]